MDRGPQFLHFFSLTKIPGKIVTAFSVINMASNGTPPPPRHNTREHSHLHPVAPAHPPSSFGASSPTTPYTGGDFPTFLESVLTEEERRTRTRHLPEVDNVLPLSKAECKADLKNGRDFDQEPFEAPTVLVDESERDTVYNPSSFKTNRTGFPNNVESLTTYNPPRPPESGGLNKKKRVARWEKDVNLIEGDLTAYKRTVTKTGEELVLAETEREKVECVAAAVRRHFLAQLEGMKGEVRRVEEEVEEVGMRVDVGDGLGTRKRGKRTVKEIVAALRAAGRDMQDKLDDEDGADAKLGVGGIGGVVDQGSGGSILGQKEVPSKLAGGWVLPGDLVETPYGRGRVISVVGPSAVKDGVYLEVTPGRVEVELSYGKCYCGPSDARPLANPATMTDKRLAQRWRLMLQSAAAGGCTLDPGSMVGETTKGYDVPSGDAELVDKSLLLKSNSEDDDMDVEGDETNGVIGGVRLIRFGDNLIPTPGGRGSALASVPLPALRQALANVENGAVKATGFKAEDPSLIVPDGFEEWEDERIEIYKLKGHLMQLKKILKRQESARSMAEKALNIAKAFEEKQERELSEMRTDLEDLKAKCVNELKELGISDAKAKAMLRDKLSNPSAPTANAADIPKPKRKVKPQTGPAAGPARASKRKKVMKGNRGAAKAVAVDEVEKDDMKEDEKKGGGVRRGPKRGRGGGEDDVGEEIKERAKPKRGARGRGRGSVTD